MLKLPAKISAINPLLFMLPAWLLVFVFKYSDLFLPYYWDEMAGYMSGIIYMCDNGISLMPSAVPASMSYGHPLLMHVVMAGIMKVFGSSPFIMHLSTLVFTYLLSLGVYLLVYELSKDRTHGLFAFLILLAQPVVLALSTQVLLETFLTMHTVFSILFYIRRQYLLSVLFCVFGILTKETGLVLAIALFVHTVLGIISAADSEQKLKRILIFSLPFAVFGGFLLLTKQSFGWYLNPVNVGKSKLEAASMLQKIWDYPLEFTFINQGRYVYSIVLIAAIMLYLMSRRSDKFRGSMNEVLMIIFSFGFILFSSIADSLERYFLMLIPAAAWIFALAIRSFGRYHQSVPYLLLGCGLIANVLNLESSRRYTETDMGYRHVVRTNRAIFDYVNSGEFRNDTIAFAFPFQYAAADPRFGYYQNKQFTADTSFAESTVYKVYTRPGNMDWNPPDTSKYLKVREFTSGFSGSFLFKKK